MNTDTKKVISRDLEILRGYLHKIDKAKSNLAECVADAAAMSERIDALGTPSYKDEKAVLELAALKQKLELCNREAAGHEAAVDDGYRKLQSIVSERGDRAHALLVPIFEQRVETISAILRPFCNSDHSAEMLAKQTDACDAARRALATIGLAPSSSRDSEDRARTYVSIFEQALKADGDLMQFLTPR